LRLLDDPEIEEDSGQDMDEDFLELPTYKNLRKEKDERWNESDLV